MTLPENLNALLQDQVDDPEKFISLARLHSSARMQVLHCLLHCGDTVVDTLLSPMALP